MTLTEEQMQLLAQIEGDMDSGKQPFVQTHHGRLALPQAILDAYGLVSGQTVSREMVSILMEMNLAYLKTELAVEKDKNG